MPGDLFTITVTQHDLGAGRWEWWARLTGELDTDGCDDLRASLTGLVTDGTAERIVIDLERVSFVDCAAVRALLDCCLAAKWAGTAFRIRNAHGIVFRVISLLGLLGALDSTR